jgi:uncharacterized protein (DUF1330 family)
MAGFSWRAAGVTSRWKGNVVARFPSFDDAVACYNSSAYQAALAHAKAASERDLVIVEETPPPAK